MRKKIKEFIDSNVFSLWVYFSIYLLAVYAVFLAIMPEIKIEKLIFLISIIPLFYFNIKIISFLVRWKNAFKTGLAKKNIIYYLIIFLLIGFFLFAHEWDIFVKITILFFSISLILMLDYRIAFLISLNLIFGIQISLMMKMYDVANIISTSLYYFLIIWLICFLEEKFLTKDKKEQKEDDNQIILLKNEIIFTDKVYTDISIFWFAFFIAFMYLLKDLRFEMNWFVSITMMIFFIFSWLFFFQKFDVKKMLKNQILKYIFIALIIPYLYFFISFILPFFR